MPGACAVMARGPRTSLANAMPSHPPDTTTRAAGSSPYTGESPPDDGTAPPAERQHDARGYAPDEAEHPAEQYEERRREEDERSKRQYRQRRLRRSRPPGVVWEFACHGLGAVLTENTAPCGSDITASREISVSNGGMIIAPPSFSALSAVASASATQKLMLQ